MRQKDAVGRSHLEYRIFPCVVNWFISSIFDEEFDLGLLLDGQVANVVALWKRYLQLWLLPLLYVTSRKHFI